MSKRSIADVGAVDSEILKRNKPNKAYYNKDIKALLGAIKADNADTVRRIMQLYNLTPNIIFSKEFESIDEYGHIEVVYKEIDDKAAEKCDYPKYLIHRAYEYGSKNVIQYLLTYPEINFYQFKKGNVPLCYQYDNPEIVKLTIEHPSYDINNLEVSDERADGGISLLMHYVDNNNKEMVKWLLENAANVNQRDDINGECPLMYCKDLDIAKLIVNHAGFDPNNKSNDESLCEFDFCDGKIHELICSHEKFVN